MWILVLIIAMVLIMGVNIGWQFRDWHWKRWLAKTDMICPKCKSDDIEDALAETDLKNMFKKVKVCRNCGYFWTGRKKVRSDNAVIDGE